MSRYTKSGVGMAAMVAFAALASGCASNPVSSSWDSEADFSKYRTYTFAEKDDRTEEQYQSLGAKRIEASIVRELEARGYTQPQEGATADLLVDYHGELEDKQKIVSSPTTGGVYGGYGGYGRYGGYGVGVGYSNSVSTVDYKQGTLSIVLVDNAKKQMVWEGSIQDSVSKKELNNPGETLSNAVTQIFAPYPFTAGSAVPAGKDKR
ncbi:MAG: DUF4136 domain-containing protein [Gammaproteobacteria bacterium]|nr:DUF4136 domain-containing protein [Gammaproteobacteria bacterium]